MHATSSTIIAFAGRRIDAPDAVTVRFPLSEISAVYRRIETFVQHERVGTLICSAACGADLIALRAAITHGLDVQVILPFSVDRFRQTSVVDRPSTSEWNWNDVFDEVLDFAGRNDCLHVLETAAEGRAAYQAVNYAILDAALQTQQSSTLRGAQELPGSSMNVQAAIAWDGRSRGSADLTFHFANAAWAKGLSVTEILTVPN